MSEEHLFQIWCLYLFYKESYDQKTDSMSFLEIYDILHYIICYKLSVIMIEDHGSSNFLHVGCWNVGSLINMDGDVEIATVQPRDLPISVDNL